VATARPPRGLDTEWGPPAPRPRGRGDIIDVDGGIRVATGPVTWRYDLEPRA